MARPMQADGFLALCQAAAGEAAHGGSWAGRLDLEVPTVPVTHAPDRPAHHGRLLRRPPPRVPSPPWPASAAWNWASAWAQACRCFLVAHPTAVRAPQCRQRAAARRHHLRHRRPRHCGLRPPSPRSRTARSRPPMPSRPPTQPWPARTCRRR